MASDHRHSAFFAAAHARGHDRLPQGSSQAAVSLSVRQGRDAAARVQYPVVQSPRARPRSRIPVAEAYQALSLALPVPQAPGDRHTGKWNHRNGDHRRWPGDHGRGDGGATSPRGRGDPIRLRRVRAMPEISAEGSLTAREMALADGVIAMVSYPTEGRKAHGGKYNGCSARAGHARACVRFAGARGQAEGQPAVPRPAERRYKTVAPGRTSRAIRSDQPEGRRGGARHHPHALPHLRELSGRLRHLSALPATETSQGLDFCVSRAVDRPNLDPPRAPNLDCRLRRERTIASGGACDVAAVTADISRDRRGGYSRLAEKLLEGH